MASLVEQLRALASSERKTEVQTPTSLRPEVQTLVKKLRQAGRVESAKIGEAGSPSDIHALAEEIWNIASEQELLLLLDDKSPIVRFYAFTGIKDRFPKVKLFPLLMERLGDSEEVEAQFGCIIFRAAVADLLIMEIESQLTPSQKNKLHKLAAQSSE